MGGSEGEPFVKTQSQRNAKSRGKTINKASWSGIRTGAEVVCSGRKGERMDGWMDGEKRSES
jgi:hypothetical protein